MTKVNLKEIVHGQIGDILAAGQIVDIESVTHKILDDHNEITGPDRDFHIICAYEHMKKLIKAAVPKYHGEGGGNLFPGYEHLMEAYPVSRGGRRLLVPVLQLTDDEIRTRAAEYIAMAKGSTAHAKELLSVIDVRSQGMAA